MNPFMSSFHLSPILLLVIGFCVSTMSSFYGIGGGWLITPTLNILGLPMPYAIGTSLVYITITAFLGTLHHRKLKNISYMIGIVTGTITVAGLFIGKRLIFYLEGIGSVDNFVRIIYIFFLTIVGTYMLLEKKINPQSLKTREKRLTIPPILLIHTDDKNIVKVSLIKLLFIGFFVGFLISTMGVGGGFVLLPIFIYIIKLSVPQAIGTSLLTVLISSVSGSILYITSQRVDWSGTFYLSLSAIIGTFIGSYATKRVNPRKIKAFFALTVLFGVVAVLSKQLKFELLSNIIIFSIIISMFLVIIFTAYIKKSR